MAFAHGKNAVLLANGYNLTGYLRNATAEINVATPDTTVWGLNATDHLVGTFSGSITSEGLFDGSSGAIHTRLSTAFASADSDITLLPAGSALGNAGFALSGTQVKYSVTEPVEDVVTVSFEAQSNGGAILPVSELQALTAVTSTGNKTGIDGGAASATGWTAWLQVTAFSGTDCTIKLIDSATGVSSGMGDVSGGSFTQFTGITSEKIASSTTTAALKQYVGVNFAGTFSSVTCSVVVARNRG